MYSIVLNNYLAPSVKSLEDAIVVTLAKSGEGRTEGVRPRSVRGAQTTDLECAWVKPRHC